MHASSSELHLCIINYKGKLPTFTQLKLYLNDDKPNFENVDTLINI